MNRLSIRTDKRYGVVVTITDVEMADSFDDYLVQHFPKEVLCRFNETSVEFFLGSEWSSTTAKTFCEDFDASY